jgi:prepilin-type N-terminal cleavage/methylation domain-containing protein
MYMLKSRPGFTIVELLIVIVVIGILVAITIVAYNGMQNRSRDSRRTSDIAAIQKLLELYKADNGGYPLCGSSSAYVPPNTNNTSYSDVTTCLTAALIPKYAATLPADPVNANSNKYFYAVGYQKNSNPTPFSNNYTNNYIIAAKFDTITSPTFSGWSRTDLTFIAGSSN